MTRHAQFALWPFDRNTRNLGEGRYVHHLTISNNNVTLLGIDESCRDFIIVREYSHRSRSNVALVLLQGDGTFEVNAGEVVSNV